ncbi:MAG: alanine--tRNA ligase-related protein, partial [Patescibacteria group bacterium]
PDSEIFYWTPDDIPPPEKYDPNDSNWVEIWNNVFMQYNKTTEGKFEPLAQFNVDTGLGFERLVMILNQKQSVYETSLFQPLHEILIKYIDRRDLRSERIVLDHVRTAIFLLAEKITPSNLEQGYVLRKIIRRAIRHMRQLEVKNKDYTELFRALTIELVTGENFDYSYSDYYPELKNNLDFVIDELIQETNRFTQVLERGIKELDKYLRQNPRQLSGRLTFKLYDTYGFPIEMTQEMAGEQGIEVDVAGYAKAFAKHQQLSQLSSAAKFKGGLADHSAKTTAYHTATHILHAVLRQELGEHVEQKGSNITAERLRFDFSHPDKLTPDQIINIEAKVNQIFQQDIEVVKEEMPVEQALAEGALGLFAEKYGAQVSVYTIRDKKTSVIYSKEICGGPHVVDNANFGTFKIIKEESSSAGVRRIKAVIE